MNTRVKLTANIDQLEAYLKAQGWMGDSSTILKTEVPGDGNMNFTLRVVLKEGSFILKQSRDYVEKYPQVAAPIKRVLQEALFYKAVGNNGILASQMPKLMGIDTVNNVLKLEDLGDGDDFSFLYRKKAVLTYAQLKQLIGFAATLHTSIQSSNNDSVIENMEMRRLNHEHIFLFPYLENNGLDLDTICNGLGAIASRYKTDGALKDALQPLGERYLQTGNSLLHGDFFPGSWLQKDGCIKIIDAEFCYFGDPEFEMGVMLAHLYMADQPLDMVKKAISLYTESAPLDVSLCRKYMAVEILRRILGLAQLPLTIDLEKRRQLLAMSRELLVSY